MQPLWCLVSKYFHHLKRQPCTHQTFPPSTPGTWHLPATNLLSVSVGSPVLGISYIENCAMGGLLCLLSLSVMFLSFTYCDSTYQCFIPFCGLATVWCMSRPTNHLLFICSVMGGHLYCSPYLAEWALPLQAYMYKDLSTYLFSFLLGIYLAVELLGPR